MRGAAPPQPNTVDSLFLPNARAVVHAFKARFGHDPHQCPSQIELRLRASYHAKGNLALLAIATRSPGNRDRGDRWRRRGSRLVSQPTIYADLSKAAQTLTQHLTASPARASPKVIRMNSPSANSDVGSCRKRDATSDYDGVPGLEEIEDPIGKRTLNRSDERSAPSGTCRN
jgi:hypothetical protein